MERHAPPPLRKKARSWRRLQALKTRGNGCLGAGEGVGRAGHPKAALGLHFSPVVGRIAARCTDSTWAKEGSEALEAEPREGK